MGMRECPTAPARAGEVPLQGPELVRGAIGVRSPALLAILCPEGGRRREPVDCLRCAGSFRSCSP